MRGPASRLDGWLTRRVFQRIVDWSQRQPADLTAHAGMVAAVGLGVGTVLLFQERSLVWTVLNAVAVLFFLAIGLRRMSVLGSTPSAPGSPGAGMWWRLLFLLLLSLDAVDLILHILAGTLTRGTLPLAVATSAAILAMLYFPTCNPPAPPKRREKLVRAGATG